MRLELSLPALTAMSIAIAYGCSDDSEGGRSGTGGTAQDASSGGSSGSSGSAGAGGTSGMAGNGGSTGTAGSGGSSGVGGSTDAGDDDAGPSGSGGTDSGPCDSTCSADGRSVVDCNGTVITSCDITDACDPLTVTCLPACTVANDEQLSTGCEFVAVNMDRTVEDACFAVFVVNAWTVPAHLGVSYEGMDLPVADFTRIPSGKGTSVTYAPFDATAGLPPGQAAILFLGGSSASCPVPAAVPTGSHLSQASGIGDSFLITSDTRIAAYQMNPYGLGNGIPGASLLLPTGAWGTSYVAVAAAPFDVASPSFNVAALQDQTTVTLLPVAAIQGGGGLPAGPAGAAYSFMLNQGQHAQFTQTADLTGSIIVADQRVSVMAGQSCMRLPAGVAYCDHAEQVLPPVQATGHEYAAVMFRPRVAGDAANWRLVGIVDGTMLTYAPTVNGPTLLSAGQSVTFETDEPFVVHSQDNDHPFLLFAEMTGSASLQPEGYGDPDFVLQVPPEQFLTEYHFYTDPLFPETNLVLVRKMAEGAFADVTLDCAGVVGGWQTLGSYQWARVDLTRGNFEDVGNCSSGYHHIESDAPFGVSVWGWGSPQTTAMTSNASYGYPAGMAVRPINSVTLSATP